MLGEKTVGFVGAHPDDVELGCGGTLQIFKQKKWKVVVLVLTSDPTTNKVLKQSADLLDYELVLAGGLNGQLTDKFAYEAVRGFIDLFKPSIVFGHSPHDDHLDHQAASRGTDSACRAVRNLLHFCGPLNKSAFNSNVQIIFYEEEHNKKKAALELFEKTRRTGPTRYLTITSPLKDTFLGQKISEYEKPRGVIWIEKNGKRLVPYAEEFEAVRIRDPFCIEMKEIRKNRNNRAKSVKEIFFENINRAKTVNGEALMYHRNFYTLESGNLIFTGLIDDSRSEKDGITLRELFLWLNISKEEWVSKGLLFSLEKNFSMLTIGGARELARLLKIAFRCIHWGNLGGERVIYGDAIFNFSEEKQGVDTGGLIIITRASDKIKLAVGTRFWDEMPGSGFVSAQEFIERALTYGNAVFVAVNMDKDKSEALRNLSALYKRHKSVEIFGVSPWQRFVPALNALVYKATIAGMEYLLFQSIETVLPPDGVSRLTAHINDKSICVGAAFPGQHNFKPGRIVEGDGLTVPWNTCAIWALELLGRWGFFLEADNISTTGMEDGLTLAFLQERYPWAEASLIEIPGIKWDVEFDGRTDKQFYQRKKMESKVPSLKSHLDRLNLRPPKVRHIAAD